MHLWVEACNTAVYVQNHCPHRVLGMSTPEEDFWLLCLCACDQGCREEARTDC
jgi:hypothetical protein